MRPAEPRPDDGDVAPARRRPLAGHPEFLTRGEWATVEALTARVLPGDADAPGAREARVVTFIDRALSEAHDDLRDTYRSGVAELDALCARTRGAGFGALGESVQDEVLHDLDRGPAEDAPPDHAELVRRLGTFFAVVREHTLQGMFCDPEYGGNFEGAGWRLVGFPGAQWGYAPDQMRPGFDATLIPIRTLDDLRREHPMDGAVSRSGPGEDR